MNDQIAIERRVSLSFADALDVITSALADEGFGVLSDIDVQATMKKKLDLDVPPYRILGACNPPLAHRALDAVPQLGVLLPCNVVVREDDEGHVWVAAMDPRAVLGLVEDKVVHAIAHEVSDRLRRVVEMIA